VEEKDFDGNTYWKQTIECCAEADKSLLLYSVELPDHPDEIRYSRYLKVCFKSGEEMYKNRYFYADIIECDRLQLPEAQLMITEVEKLQDQTLRIRLHTDKFVHNVRLNILDTHVDYSDNYFDLEAGAEKEIWIQFLPMQKEDVMKDHMLYIEAENVKRFTFPLYQI